jgi:cardiolipin synthase
MTGDDDDLTELLHPGDTPAGPGFTAQVMASSAATRPTAVPEMFTSLMFSARRELVVSTPYYVPDDSIQAAFCATARRGVETTLVVPQRNDSWIVAAASRSYYPQLLEAGVRIMEFRPGLLHAKTLTLDGDTALIGSANLDRRSFELNFENNVLIHDMTITAEIRARQQSYIDRADEVTRADAESWSRRDRLWHNTVAMFGPVL